jgi:predicted CoA-binding protein
MLGKAPYPTLDTVRGQIEQAGARLHYLDPHNLPLYQGELVPDNLYVLGAALGCTSLGKVLSAETVKQVVRQRWQRGCRTQPVCPAGGDGSAGRGREVTMSVHRFFNPRGVAVVGSMSEGKLGYELLRQMILGGYRGSLYAVNPKAQGALDIPAFAAVDEIEGELDLVVIASPAPTVVETLHACGRRGVQAAVVISSGFGEVGNHAGEEALKQAARQYGIRVIGPNCAGIVSTSCNLYATLEVRPPAGKMALSRRAARWAERCLPGQKSKA